MPGKEKLIPALSLPLAALTITASVAGLLSPGFYAKETQNWAIQSAGQDIINLFLISPALIFCSILATQNNKPFISIWAGINLYLSYTFAIYCFDIHFNALFLIYCFCFGLSVFSFICFLLFLKYECPCSALRHKTPLRFIGIYFIIIAVLFYLMWLSNIFPAILSNSAPQNLKETGLFTNPVEVLDLSLILPAVFITGIFLLKGKKTGYKLTPVLLTFITLMSSTISFLNFYLSHKGRTNDISVFLVMAMFAIFSTILLIIYFINIKERNLRYYSDLIEPVHL